MNKTLFLLLICMILLGSNNVLGQILSINYPQPNAVVSQTSRVNLNVSSDGSSTTCILLIDGYSNTSVLCNGLTTVNLPNADGDYILTVVDEDDTSVTQHVYIVKPVGAMAIIIHLSSFVIMLLMIFLIFLLLLKFVQLRLNLYHVLVCWASFALFLFFYQLTLEYLNMGLLINWFNLLLKPLGWVMVVASALLYFAVSMINTLKTGKNCFAPGWDEHK